MTTNSDHEVSWARNNFGLDRRLVKALSKLGFSHPTLVQSKCLPIAMEGKDILVRARTGSGKTYAYCLPLLHKLLTIKDINPSSSKITFGVILAPTKELCKQIEKNITDLLYYCKDLVSICCLSEDNTAVLQYKLQTLPDIVISTPAKLAKVIETKKLSISDIKILVIDEADLLLSFGYAEDVQLITSHMPKVVQGLLMSATLSPALDKFKRIVLNNPVILKLEEEANSGTLIQYYLRATPKDKYLILYVFLKLGLLQGKGLIFVNDINKCYKLKLVLQQFFINAAVLNAEMPLNSRVHTIEEFNRGVFDYLIATDASVDQGNDDDEDEDEVEDDEGPNEQVGDKRKQSRVRESSGYGVHRGLDFQGVSFVVNFDFPSTSASYTHRVGRTARAGASGTALSFISLPSKSSETREEDVSQRDEKILREIQEIQPRIGSGDQGSNLLSTIAEESGESADESNMQPAPLMFNSKEIESFRYRVEDTVRGVTSAAVRELRTAEIKKEILNSEKLKTFFAENPNDFRILRHDTAVVHPVRIKEHLKVVPSYLMPPSMQAIAVNAATQSNKKKKRRSSSSGSTQDQRINNSKMRDPLRNPSAASVVEQPKKNESQGEEVADADDDDQEERIFTNKEAGNLGRSMSGRNKWKLRHGKGKFNPRNAKKSQSKVAGTFSKRRK